MFLVSLGSFGISAEAHGRLNSAEVEKARIELAGVRLDVARTLSDVQLALIDGQGAAAAAGLWDEVQPGFVERLDSLAATRPELVREVTTLRAAVDRPLVDSASSGSAIAVRVAGRAVGDIVAATAGDDALEGNAAVPNAVAVDVIRLQRSLDAIVVAKAFDGDLPAALASTGLADNEALVVGTDSLIAEDGVSFTSTWTLQSLDLADEGVLAAQQALAADPSMALAESATAWAVGRLSGRDESASAPSSFADIVAAASTLSKGELSLGTDVGTQEGDRANATVRDLDGRRQSFFFASMISSVIALGASYLMWRVARNKEDQLREAASTDPMTGIGNRGYLDEASEALRDEDGELVLLHIDLDHFKPVNDSYGHAVGDQVLRLASSRLRTVAEEANGIVARLGGDEFAIALPPATADHVDGVCNAVLERLTTFEVDGIQLSVGASVGVAAGSGGIPDLLLNSDLALYQAKRSGRGSASTFQAEAAKFVSFVRETLLAGDVHAAYQGQYSLQTGSCIGIEVLARLSDPVRGSIPAKEWVGVAEWLGVTAELFEHVVGAVASDLQDGMEPNGRLWFNVSPNDMLRSGGVDWLLTNLKRLGLPPGDIGLELTETEAIGEPGRLTAMVTDLRRVGLGVALDGFGARSSPIGHLVDIPVTRVKLDSSLINGLGPTTSPVTWVVGAMTNLAQRLNIELVAEGVSSGEQLRALAKLGVPGAQGFLFCLPGPMNRAPGSVDLALAAQTTLRSLEVDPDMDAPLARQGGR